VIIQVLISSAIFFAKSISPDFPPEIFFNDTSRKPTWSLEETTVDSMKLVSIRDTVLEYDSFQVKLGKDYSQIFAFVFQKGLRPAKILATYLSSGSPLIFEACVEVEKFPSTTAGRIEFKILAGGKMIIAHFQGPYNEVKLAYKEIQNFMKAQNKEANGPPFEVYLNNPSAVKDTYDLKTDLYQPIRNK
jgi:effector-binding domain-containing protein